jgi:hypothetical protein
MAARPGAQPRPGAARFRRQRGEARGDYTGGIGYLSWNPSDALGTQRLRRPPRGQQRARARDRLHLLNGTSVGATPTPIRIPRAPSRAWAWTGACAQGAWGWLFGAGFDYTRTGLDAYTETGGEGLALSVPAAPIDHAPRPPRTRP